MKPARETDAPLQTPAHTSPQARKQSLLSQNITGHTWREIATLAGFPIPRLNKGEREILDMVSRVLIQGKGWGRSDKLRNIRVDVRISPREMADHGSKLHVRTYQRSLGRLLALGLLIRKCTGVDQVSIYGVAWWPDVADEEAIEIWSKAASLLESVNRRNSAAQQSHARRAATAPPVPADPRAVATSNGGYVDTGATSAETATENGYGGPQRGS